MAEVAIALLVAAFAGGVLGASVGALPAFSLAGVIVVVGEAVALVAPSAGATLTGEVGFGVVLGPHVAFGGGAAAVAYAARRDYLEGPFEYHPAKAVTRGLGASPDVLVVGGAFGVAGYALGLASETVAAPWDPVAFGVVASAFLHRAVLGYHVVGRPTGGWLDVSGGESAETDTTADGGRLAEPWLPYQSGWPGVAVLGVTLGVLGGYLAHVTGSAFLGFGLSVASLVFVNAGVAEVSVTHHVTLPASTAVLALVPGAGARADPTTVAAAVPLGEALAVGAAFGLVGALAGELAARILYAHAETHLDPPAASIVVTTFLIAALALAGVLPDSAWVPHP